MEREFYRIYEELYLMYSGYPEEHLRYPFDIDELFRRYHGYSIRSIRPVRMAIEKVVDEMRLYKRLRPDAKYFLLVNLHQMIVLPVIQHGGERIDIGSQLERILEDDVRTILTEAESFGRSEGENNREISGRTVLGALARVYEQLKVASFRIWGE